MNRFWKVINTAESKNAEIRIYGVIADKKSWGGNETAPEGFAQALESFQNKPLTIRINSSGGSVFAAHAIYNLVKSYTGEVTAIIDGLAASAATIIAVAADKIIMPTNSMMMVHDPMITLDGAMNEAELQECINALRPIKESIVSAYLNRVTVSAEELCRMMADTTWLTAKECLEKGFCDEIAGKVDIMLDHNFLVVNQIRHPLTGEDVEKIKNKTEVKSIMNDELMKMLEKAANALGLTVTAKNPTGNMNDVVQTKTEVAEKLVESGAQIMDENAVVMTERQRMLALDALDNGSTVVRQIINMAKETGKTVEDVQAYIDIINKAPDTPAMDYVKNLVADKQESGIENVTGNPGTNAQETDAIRTERMSNMMMK